MTKEEIKPHKISGKEYYTIQQFAIMSNRSEANVRHLLYVGNSKRKLQSIKVVNRPMIPIEELQLFPFTKAGFGGGDVYHYDEHGNVVEETESVFNVGNAE